MPAAGRRRHPRGQDAGAAQARRRAGVHQQPALVQHPGQPAPHPARAQGACRAGGLLDLHVHQLHPHAAVPQGAVRPLPPLRPGRGRRRDARVHLRAGGLQRPAGHQLRRPALPGRPGQPLRDLERLPEPVLAGGVPDRQDRPGPPHPVRRRRLQAGRGGGARAALRGRRSQPAAADDGHGDHAVEPTSAPRRPTSTPSARRGSPSSCKAAPTPTRASQPRSSTSSACTAHGRPPPSRSRRPRPAPGSRAASRPPTSTW